MPTLDSAAEVVSRLALSDLAPRAVQSEIRAMSAESDRIGGINLAQGVCDTDPPAVVVEGAIAAIRSGHNIYTRADGITRLRQAVAAQVARTHGLSVDPEREVIITSGATAGYHAAAMALLNPGDEVILFEPGYGYHAATLRSMRINPVLVRMTEPGWALDASALRAAITPRTRAILVNTPGNPTGKVFTRAEIELIASLAQQHDLFLFTDEIYEHFLYGDTRHVSPAELPGMRERAILISGFSKTFSVTGWRVGYTIADARWAGAISYFHDLTYVCSPAPFQHGVADGVEQLGPEFYRGLASDHQRKRDMLVSALRDAGLTPEVPDGAYYILADSTSIPGTTGAERARHLLAETGVAAVSGAAFFRPGHGEDILRFCFAKKDADLAEACRRLRTRAR
jgi:aminotransferase